MAEVAQTTGETSLTARQAEDVVQERIEQFGLGALPELKVSVLADGSWQVRWDDFERIVQPMPLQQWETWLEEHVGPLDAASLQTTES